MDWKWNEKGAMRNGKRGEIEKEKGERGQGRS